MGRMRNYVIIVALLCLTACTKTVEVLDVIEVQHELLPADTIKSKLSKTGKICSATKDAEFMIINDKLIL